MSDKKDELIIHVMHGYDSLEAPTGVECFGCYIVGDYEIYVADNIPTDQLFHTIAHEYMHYLQDIEGRKQNEDEANAFGFSVFTPCYHEGLDKAIEAIKSYYDECKENCNSDFEYDVLSDLVCRIEQLKEQKNDNRRNRI